MSNDQPKAPGKRAPRKRSRSKPRSAPRPDAPAANANPARAATEPAAADAAPPRRDEPTPAAPERSHSPALATIPLHVRWRDLDAFNHVNNSSYLTFLEEARLQWLRTVPGEWFTANAMPVMAAVELHYRKPITWPSEIAVLLSCERLGNTSITIGNRIVDRKDANCVYADGNVVMVWVDPASGAAVPLPAAIRAACA